jgi:hypothetical protein
MRGVNPRDGRRKISTRCAADAKGWASAMTGRGRWRRPRPGYVTRSTSGFLLKYVPLVGPGVQDQKTQVNCASSTGTRLYRDEQASAGFVLAGARQYRSPRRRNLAAMVFEDDLFYTTSVWTTSAARSRAGWPSIMVPHQAGQRDWIGRSEGVRVVDFLKLRYRHSGSGRSARVTHFASTLRAHRPTISTGCASGGW